MRLSSAIKLGFAFSALLGLSSAKAQLFQNNNNACETKLTICDSLAIPCNSTSNATSISCKNIDEEADFDGDGYSDCALASSTGPSNFQLSVFLNRGTTAVPCGEQFNPGVNYGLFQFQGPVNPPPYKFGSITTGKIDASATSQNLSDIVIADIYDAVPNEWVLTAIANGTLGGFGNPANALMPQIASWDASPNGFNQTGFSATQTDRNAAIFDCDQDKDLDFVMAVFQTGVMPLQQGTDPISAVSSDLFINILKNDAGALQPATAATSFPVTLAQPGTVAALTVEDFNNDGNTDVALVTRDSQTLGFNRLAVCLNQGSCDFSVGSCTSFALTQNLPNPLPFSIAAADFNGDGNQDLAISQANPAARKIKFFFGDGSGTFTNTPQTTLEVPFLGQPVGSSLTSVITTGCFDNNNRPDLAVNYTSTSATIDLIGLDASGSLKLHENLFIADTAILPGGIDSADLDKQGGDDLIAIFTDTSVDPFGDRKIAVFMNALEDIGADAGADQIGGQNAVFNLNGACLIGPNDPNAEFETTWEITSSPAGSNPVLTAADTLNPVLTTDLDGTYTVKLSCRTRCDTIVTDSVILTTQSGPICGNGVLENGEQCDDSNIQSGDGCSATCQFETGIPTCGNEVVENGEECDDGNTQNGDGCSSICQKETLLSACGNEVIENGEECDDGNTQNLDGCSSDCKKEDIFSQGGCLIRTQPASLSPQASFSFWIPLSMLVLALMGLKRKH